jgi:hypothetical protein
MWDMVCHQKCWSASLIHEFSLQNYIIGKFNW